MNVYIPFICLALGAAINWRGLPEKILQYIDYLTNLALFLLMVVIGINIGTSEEVMDNLNRIGINCFLISLSAVACSVVVTVLLEKTIMPLEKIRLQLHMEKGASIASDTASGSESKSKGRSSFSPLIVIMPACIAVGMIAGRFFMQNIQEYLLDAMLTGCLIFLYTGVGVSLASNKSVFSYIRRLGFRVLLMPTGIFAGCLFGGMLAGAVLSVPTNWAVLSASGMGYYSLTGAAMTDTFGIEAGTYGFIVNILRDVLTVALLPVLLRISKGSPIASGAAGCMESMLVPVSRYVGPELSMVALISGTILTFVVPLWLPMGTQLLT